jgi:hypothetical protein
VSVVDAGLTSSENDGNGQLRDIPGGKSEVRRGKKQDN